MFEAFFTTKKYVPSSFTSVPDDIGSLFSDAVNILPLNVIIIVPSFVVVKLEKVFYNNFSFFVYDFLYNLNFIEE